MREETAREGEWRREGVRERERETGGSATRITNDASM